MKKFFFLVSASLTVLASEVPFESALIKEHHVLEGADGHFIHSGYLWMAEAANDTVSLYKMTGEKEFTYQISHRPGSVVPIDDDRVMVVGHDDDGFDSSSAYSVLSLSQRKVIKKYNFSLDTVVENFAVAGGNWYFTIPNEHALGIVAGNSLRRLDLGTNIPRRFISAGDNLYFVERGFDKGDAVVRYDTRTKEVVRVMSQLTGAPSHLYYMTTTNQVAVSEPFGNRLSVIENGTATTQSITIPGHPRAITQLGGCFLVTAEDTRRLHFLVLQQGGPHEIGSWDLSGIGKNFTRPNSLAADVASGSIFVRSTNPCVSCGMSQSSTWRLKERGHGMVSQCLAR